MAILTVSAAEGAQRRYEVLERCILGRDPECDIHDVFEGAGRVSGHHALLFRRDSAYYLEDLGSRNGTRLNGRPLRQRTELRSGDRIGIEDVEFHFSRDNGEAPAAAEETAAPEAPADPAGILAHAPLPARGAKREAEGAGRRLWALLELLEGLGRTIEVQETFERILVGLFAIFPQASRGFVGVRDPDSGELIVRAVRHRDEGAAKGQVMSRTLTDLAMEMKEAILTVDASHDPRFVRSKSIMSMQMRSVMCTPLIDDEGAALGVLQVDAEGLTGGFDDEDVEVLASIAPQAAMALRVAQLHEEALARKTLDRDLDLARRVQLALLPSARPDVAGYAFYDHYAAAYQVGGDFYDYVPLSGGRVAIVVADAFGKGISAALLIAKLSGELRTYLQRSASAPEAVDRMGASLEAMSEELPCGFVTLVLLVLDPAAHRLEIVNAGHALPLLRRGDGRVESVGEAERGPTLGMFPDRPYRAADLELAPGEMLLVFTDGYNEATNAGDEQYGMERLRARFAAPAPSLEAVCDGLEADVQGFVGGHRQSDDMCMICLGRS